MISKKYNQIIKAAIAGGNVVEKYFGKSLKIEGKTVPSDFRTKADLESEKAILKILEKEFPDYNIYSEEAGEINKNSEYTFIIDPLDGTNNFVLGIPNFAVSIGLFLKDQAIFGVVYNPILKNIYYAEKGRGAFLGGKKIKVNQVADIENSSVSWIANYGFSVEDSIKIVGNFWRSNVKRVLTNWSVAMDLCFLAAGKIEAAVIHKLPIYDFAAGIIIAKEAGALLTDLSGNPLKNDKENIFLITNGTKIHQEILEILNK